MKESKRVLKLYPQVKLAQYDFNKYRNFYENIGEFAKWNKQQLTLEFRGVIYHFMSQEFPEKLQGMRFDRIEVTEEISSKTLHEILYPIISSNNCELTLLSECH